jgi:hypothetical protein
MTRVIWTVDIVWIRDVTRPNRTVGLVLRGIR